MLWIMRFVLRTCLFCRHPSKPEASQPSHDDPQALGKEATPPRATSREVAEARGVQPVQRVEACGAVQRMQEVTCRCRESDLSLRSAMFGGQCGSKNEKYKHAWFLFLRTCSRLAALDYCRFEANTILSVCLTPIHIQNGVAFIFFPSVGKRTTM